MEVNNHGQNNQVIYPRNIKKYTGSIYERRSKAKNGKASSFSVCIKVSNFKYCKNFSSRVEAEAVLIRQNIENNLEIKNILRDCGSHYAVRLFNGKEFLADKIDLHFIESYIWGSSDRNYVSCKPNKKHIMFHNLILNHNPTMDLSVDHMNRNPLDNRRVNLRIVTQQTQSINRNPRNKAIQPGVSSNKDYWISNWKDENNVQKHVYFNIKKLGYEVAKQLAIAKRLEMELSLNHYRIALHGLPPLEQDELEPEVPDEKPDEM